MELVIKIPEDEYKWIIKSDKTVFADVASKECMLHAIKNGIPLPKGHGRLGDLDKILREGSIDYYTEFGCEVWVSALDIDLASTIIPADEEGEEV